MSALSRQLQKWKEATELGQNGNAQAADGHIIVANGMMSRHTGRLCVFTVFTQVGTHDNSAHGAFVNLPAAHLTLQNLRKGLERFYRVKMLVEFDTNDLYQLRGFIQNTTETFRVGCFRTELSLDTEEVIKERDRQQQMLYRINKAGNN